MINCKHSICLGKIVNVVSSRRLEGRQSTSLVTGLNTTTIDGHRAVPARPGGPACRAGMARHRASTGRRAGRAVPRPCSCLVNGPWHGPWAVLPCRAARWARPFSLGHAGPWSMMHTSHITVHTSQNQSFTVHTITLHRIKVHTSFIVHSFTEKREDRHSTQMTDHMMMNLYSE